MSHHEEETFKVEQAKEYRKATEDSESAELTDDELSKVAAGSVGDSREQQLKEYQKRVRSG